MTGSPTGSTIRPHATLRRRGVLAAAFGLLVAPAVLSGCTSGPTGPDLPLASLRRAQRSADDTARQSVAESAQDLAAMSASVAERAPALRRLLTRVSADHRAHLVALGASEPSPGTATSALPGAATSATPGAATSGATPGPSATATVTPGPGVRDLVSAERRAAAAALAQIGSTSPGLATLLARIAAACAAHADLLARTARLPTPPPGLPSPTPTSPTPTSPTPTSVTTGPTPTSPTPTSVTTGPTLTGHSPTGPSPSGQTGEQAAWSVQTRAAVSSLLQGQHAAVFAYGVVVARVAPARRALARAAWETHRQRRDALERLLADRGVQPDAASPAYDVGRVDTPRAAAQLALHVEEGLATLAAQAVGGTEGSARLWAAEQLVEAARSAALWQAAPVALPGGP